MPTWDDNRSYRQDRERRRPEDDSRQSRDRDADRRSFEDERGRFNSDMARYGQPGGRGEGEREPWRRERYGSRYDQDRAAYGAGYDRDHAEYGRGVEDEEDRFAGYAYAAGEPLSYGGQEYGIEGHGSGASGGGGGYSRSGGWALEGRAQSGAGHAAGAHPDADLDPDYCRWRDDQLRTHDRDYQEWRTHQHRQYDDDYRRFRSERREQFGRAFQDWRQQRTTVGGIPDTAINAGQSGYGDPVAIPGGNYLHAQSRPSGAHDAAPGHITDDPAMQQTGVTRSATGAGRTTTAPTTGPTATTGADFDAEPVQVKAVTGGGEPGDQRNDNKNARH